MVIPYRTTKLNPPIVLLWVQLPNLIPANKSGYMVLLYLPQFILCDNTPAFLNKVIVRENEKVDESSGACSSLGCGGDEILQGCVESDDRNQVLLFNSQPSWNRENTSCITTTESGHLIYHGFSAYGLLRPRLFANLQFSRGTHYEDSLWMKKRDELGYMWSQSSSFNTRC